MGREIKRVDLQQMSQHPLGKAWPGFLLPKELCSTPCHHCDQTGYNDATRAIAETYYDSAGHGVRWTYDYGFDPQGNPAARPPWRIIGECLSWSSKLEQDEVNHLAAEGRLMDFTHTFTSTAGWKVREDCYVPSAAEVNLWNATGMGHDGINRHILIQFRATKAGVYGVCEHCAGTAELWASAEQQAQSEAWVETPPMAGTAWQVWETVSEGSPVTPAFATAEELIEHLVSNGDAWDKNRGKGGWDRAHAEQFVQDGWQPSGLMMIAPGMEDVETLGA